jgi:phosphoribosylformylglycinamidine synthase
MTKPRTLVLRTAGTNCDWETAAAWEKAGAVAERIHVNRIAENPALLHEFQILTIPGGFSYGDDVAAGAVFANELEQRFGEELYRFRDAGKLVLGICNGFQVLVRTGLLPGIGNGERVATLDGNDSGKFEDRWTYLMVDGARCAFTQGMKETVYFPVAHGEGRFVTSTPEILEALQDGDQIVFRYADKNGKPANGRYPLNPNGSQGDVAGICDPTGRILGMMPHPERHYLALQHPSWTREGLKEEGDGLAVFRSGVRYASQL